LKLYTSLCQKAKCTLFAWSIVHSLQELICTDTSVSTLEPATLDSISMFMVKLHEVKPSAILLSFQPHHLCNLSQIYS